MPKGIGVIWYSEYYLAKVNTQQICYDIKTILRNFLSGNILFFSRIF